VEEELVEDAETFGVGHVSHGSRSR
jgi:hypothetical protein